MRRYPVDATILVVTKVCIIAVLLVYLALPDLVAPFSMNFPLSIRVVGAVIGMLGIALLWWADETLGENLSVTLQIKNEHTLVTGGPYMWVRHPVYSSTLLFVVGSSLASSNSAVAACSIGGIAILFAQRIPKEEKMMLEHFGDQYRHYIGNTGRLFPRIPSFLRR
jgi:protein-S-isoprenylcysteine O-methyltransferase Ste14